MKKVSVICVDCENEYIEEVIFGQTYENLEVAMTTTGEEFYKDIVEYCESTDSEYICFLEPNQSMHPEKIQKMVEYAEKKNMQMLSFVIGIISNVMVLL